MDERNRRAFIVGAVGTIAVFAVLFFVVGARDILDSLLSAEPSLVAATFALALCWLAAWSLMLRTVLAALGIDIPVGKSFFIYAGAVFANNVTPFGQAGGEPVAALLISKTSDARYETSLVGIASVDVLNVVPSISLILVGVGYYATTAALGDHLVTAVGSAVVLIAGIVIALGLVWRYHQAIVDRLPGIVAPDSAGSGSSASSPRRSRRTSPTDWDDSSRTSNAWRRIGGDCPPSSGCRCVAGSFRSPRSWQRLPRLGPPFRRTSCCS